MTIEHPVRWMTPAPIWPGLAQLSGRAARERATGQPLILRFSSDSFMDEFLGTLERDPARLADLRAVGEEWRAPAPEPAPLPALAAPDALAPLPEFARRLVRMQLADVQPGSVQTVARAPALLGLLPAAGQDDAIKLYQPAHQRFYLVAAGLVCEVPGLPERTVHTARQERVAFVVRRLMPPPALANPSYATPSAGWDEYAFVEQGGEPTWQPVADAKRRSLAQGEERLPLFAVNYPAEAGLRRRILAGLVPVSRREAYMGARRLAAQGAAPAAAEVPMDPRLAMLRADVIGPWEELIDSLANARRALERPDPGGDDATQFGSDWTELFQQTLDSLTGASFYILLDFARFLERFLPAVWHQIVGTPIPPGTPRGDTGKEGDLLTALSHARYTRSGITLRKALEEIVKGTIPADLEDIGLTFPQESTVSGAPKWPALRFRVVDLPWPITPVIGVPGDAGYEAALAAWADGLKTSLTRKLVTAVSQAWPAEPPPRTPPLPLAARPLPPQADPGWFVLRCVYERPGCEPFRQVVVSEPSAIFTMASFFDPDAPARPIRINLPVDTSPAGLRKFAKNTAFLVSDMLACQKDRLGKLTFGDLVLSVLPWPFHKSLPRDSSGCAASGPSGAGLICSLSIPIITICALILLLIMVALLDIIFRWIPFFIFCFPLPGFFGKRRP